MLAACPVAADVLKLERLLVHSRQEEICTWRRSQGRRPAVSPEVACASSSRIPIETPSQCAQSLLRLAGYLKVRLLDQYRNEMTALVFDERALRDNNEFRFRAERIEEPGANEFDVMITSER